MIRYNLLIVFLLLLTSCERGQYRDIAHFKIEEQALDDDEYVKLLYSGHSPVLNLKDDYYIQLMVERQNGDTVNILTTSNHRFHQSEIWEVFRFMSKRKYLTDLVNEHVPDLGGNIRVENTAVEPEHNKVFINPEFDYLTDNNFPTVLGFILRLEE